MFVGFSRGTGLCVDSSQPAQCPGWSQCHLSLGLHCQQATDTGAVGDYDGGKYPGKHYSPATWEQRCGVFIIKLQRSSVDREAGLSYFSTCENEWQWAVWMQVDVWRRTVNHELHNVDSIRQVTRTFISSNGPVTFFLDVIPCIPGIFWRWFKKPLYTNQFHLLFYSPSKPLTATP